MVSKITLHECMYTCSNTALWVWQCCLHAVKNDHHTNMLDASWNVESFTLPAQMAGRLEWLPLVQFIRNH